MHDVFSNWWRRAILYHLEAYENPASLTVVTRRLIAWYRGTAEPDQRETALVERTRRLLRQSHVLELQAVDMLGYDSSSDTLWLPDDVAVSVPPPWE